MLPRLRATLAAVLAVAAAGGAAAGSLAAESPKALRASIFAAAHAERSVHYVDASRFSGGRQTMVGDVAAARGIQRITFTQNGARGRLTILVLRRTVYLRGNALGLHNEGDLSQEQASRYADRWIAVPHGEFAYARLADEVTFGTFLHHQVPEGRLTLVGGVVGGRKVVGVRGNGATMTRTVYVRTGTRPLPVAASTITPRFGTKERVTFDHWNEPVIVRAPAHAVPMAKVVGL